MALTVIPFGSWGGALRFPGDLVLFVYLLGLARVFTVLAALDTGLELRGDGRRAARSSSRRWPSRPCFWGWRRIARHDQLAVAVGDAPGARLALGSLGAGPALVVVALMVVLLAENSRMPVDDPNTHLELTMIHEVMVLDHGGPDFAFILYAARPEVVGFLLALGRLDAAAERVRSWWTGWPALAGLFGLAVLVGVVESTMARLRLIRVPQLLIGATMLSALALVLVYGEAIK